MKKFYILILIGTLMSFTSCKVKKSVIDKKEIETEEIVIDEKKKEEKKEKETETEKKEEKTVIDEWMKIESDKIIITDKDGTVTEIINPRIDKIKSENNESITDKEKVTETEENKQTERKEIAKKERKEDVSEKHTSKGKDSVWLWILFGLLVLSFVYYVFRKLRII